METVTGKLTETQISVVSTDGTGSPKLREQALSLPKMPSVKSISGKTAVDNPLGTRFTVFALGFNALGLAAITIGGVSIGGSVAAAEVVLGSSLVCLSAYLFRSILGKRRKN